MSTNPIYGGLQQLAGAYLANDPDEEKRRMYEKYLQMYGGNQPPSQGTPYPYQPTQRPLSNGPVGTFTGKPLPQTAPQQFANPYDAVQTGQGPSGLDDLMRAMQQYRQQ